MSLVDLTETRVSYDEAARPAVLQHIADLSIETAETPMSDEVSLAVRRCVIDWFGVAIAGAHEPAVVKLRAALGVPPATARSGMAALLPPGIAADHAALILGTAGHALDYDDTDYVNLIHVSSTLLPALLALGAREPLSGARLLAIFNAAYEAEDRIGAELGRKLTARGWHVSGVIGHLGGALASGMALRLPSDRLAHAMAIAATASSGLIGAFGTMSKPFQMARCGADGLTAALLAREGFTGPLALLESSPGLTVPLLGEPIGDWSSIGRQWGKPYAVTRNAFKPHASCMITHPTIDAAIAVSDDLRARMASVGDIEAIVCRVNPLAPEVAGYARPTTGLEGKFSVAYCCALGLIEGRATPDGFAADQLARPDLQALLGRIEVRPDAAIGEQQSHILVRMRNGTLYERMIEMAKGNPANPLTDAELDDKFLHLTEPVFQASAHTLLQELHRFDAIDDVGRWLRSLSSVKENPWISG